MAVVGYSRLADHDDDELEEAFAGNDHEQDSTKNVQHRPAPISIPGFYDFERDYDHPPPGSPPGPSTVALPNDWGNSNGQLPTSPVAPSAPRLPRRSFFRRIVGSVLPTHYVQVPTSSRRDRPIENDGVFANMMAKPQPVQTVRTVDQDGNVNVHLVPEDSVQKEAPPSYASAQADSVPPYWETTVHVPADSDGAGSSMFIDDLPSGPVWVFFLNLVISFFFQFVGFLLTFLLHTSHAAKFGSRAGLGLTLIQYGFYSRSMSVDNEVPNDVPNTEGTDTAPDPDAVEIASVTTRDWLSFLLMTLGWFLLLSSTVSFWRVKRWENSIRSSSTSSATPAPSQRNYLTREEVEHDIGMRRNLESVFGIPFEEGDTPTGPADTRVHFDEHGHAIVIPGQQTLEEARLARDLRAAGLL
ncbi:hypothetical protein D9758_003791 [Tetrapyrgos nigripes]|uniref:Metal homeostatis protein BSD2 n=1 Tax=Tetrapyrgos nigripes TaxID=182062 RepID=A0A8H5GMA7_9AGAR|nr:hypothetical protein D9758_003791 [Tetrapyrgos nigripes]